MRHFLIGRWKTKITSWRHAAVSKIPNYIPSRYDHLFTTQIQLIFWHSRNFWDLCNLYVGYGKRNQKSNEQFVATATTDGAEVGFQIDCVFLVCIIGVGDKFEMLVTDFHH